MPEDVADLVASVICVFLIGSRRWPWHGKCLDSGIRAAMRVVRDTELCARRARHRSFRPYIPPVSLILIGVSLIVIGCTSVESR